MVFSVYMVIEYCRTAHPVKMVREYTPALQIDDINDIMTIREMGWVLNENDINMLSTIASPLEFRLREYERSPSSERVLDVIDTELDNDLPTITIVDPIRLQEARENRQIADGNEVQQHAVVVVGIDERHVYINDPWGGIREPFTHDVFGEAWDVGLNRIVTTNLQSTLDNPTEAQ